MRGILPTLGGTILFAILAWSLRLDWSPGYGYTTWKMPLAPPWVVGGIFVIVVLSVIVGLLLFAAARVSQQAFFRGETLDKYTPSLVGVATALRRPGQAARHGRAPSRSRRAAPSASRSGSVPQGSDS